ncbi:hypothetical protein [Sphingobium algorifonticola]|uniref:Capsule biosynthesis protein n=1 Tax=Sphingobium algorifonticola TaxID=2008318 RepID=A0A437J793_9SPHN|nr:hypothetical protein [Sphingobium algorifonticola]RVT41030.1 hypothetical protein ENE74_11310 [Sphingobium algorifonticola]
MLSSIINKIKHLGAIFHLCVSLPTACALLYFGIFASDVYLSESQFVVRSPDKQAPTGLGILLKSSGFGNAGDEIFAAQSYVSSRDALAELNRRGAIEQAYTRADISIFDRYGSLGQTRSFENLYKYFRKKVEIEHESASTITKMTVRAYSAEDAFRINLRLLELSEGLVNRLSERARADLIRFAEAEVEDAEKKAASAALALSRYRNSEGIIDPEQQATVQLQMVSKLQDEMISTKMQLLQLRAFTPENPQISVLDVRVRELSQEIDRQLGKAAGDQKSLSSAVAQYQRLQLESQFADKQLAGAMASFESAKNDARRKQAYVERIVQPNKPDMPREPRRMRGILATFALGLVTWGILSMLLVGVREHNG